MITIDPKFKKDVKRLRDSIKAHQQMTDYFIQKLGERAGLTKAEDHETLWDHVYNDTDWTVEYKDAKK